MAILTNQAKLQGVLVRKNIAAGVGKSGQEYLMADLVIRVDNDKEVTVSMFANKLNFKGEENSDYKSIETIRDEYLSLNSTFKDKIKYGDKAEAKKLEATTVATLEECDYVIVPGGKYTSVTMNRFLNKQDGSIMESFKIRAKYVNRIKPEQPRTPMVEGNLVGVVTKAPMTGEDKFGEYIKLELTVPTYYNAYEDKEERISVEKFPLVLREVNDESVAYVEDNFGLNSVVSAVVEPVHMVFKEVQVEQPRGFGRVFKSEPQTKILKEINLVGGFAMEEDMFAEDPAFNFDMYEKAVKEFDESIEEMKKEKGETKQIPRGFGKQSSDLPF